MFRSARFVALFPLLALLLSADFSPAHSQEVGRSTVTVHNGGYGVVREIFPLALASREPQSLEFDKVAAHIEPSSVILRDLSGRQLRILEQNYRNDPLSQQLLLSLFEGQTIDFLQNREDGPQRVRGRIVRSGYVPHREAWQRYGANYAQRQVAYVSRGSGMSQPVIEVDGQIRFSLPGQPLFPSLEDDTVLEPTLHWLLETDQPGTRDAELTYITGGMSWVADYNLIAPEKGDNLQVDGWVTVDNNSGRTYERASLRLMAGDISKIDPSALAGSLAMQNEAVRFRAPSAGPAERTFDEYHLYEMPRATTLRDRETKQIEFLRASNVASERLYIYDGAAIDQRRYQSWNQESIRQDRNYGTLSNPKVWVMREFRNSAENGLGVPLPRGRVRFYRRDGESIEFLGENLIDHTPKNEDVRVYTGNAFDLVGSRRQTNYELDRSQDWLDESFEIKLRNHKSEAVEVRVIEHLYRWTNWEIREQTDDYLKTDSRTIEFRIPLDPDEERTLSYVAHYSW